MFMISVYRGIFLNKKHKHNLWRTEADKFNYIKVKNLCWSKEHQQSEQQAVMFAE